MFPFCSHVSLVQALVCINTAYTLLHYSSRTVHSSRTYPYVYAYTAWRMLYKVIHLVVRSWGSCTRTSEWRVVYMCWWEVFCGAWSLVATPRTRCARTYNNRIGVGFSPHSQRSRIIWIVSLTSIQIQSASNESIRVQLGVYPDDTFMPYSLVIYLWLPGPSTNYLYLRSSYNPGDPFGNDSDWLETRHEAQPYERI